MKTKNTLKKVAAAPVEYPAKLLKPVAVFLKDQLLRLQKRRENIDETDPFKDYDRVNNNASPDADAEEQFGHARARAMREQLDKKIIQTKRALTRIKLGKYGVCEECGRMIDTDRLVIYPEATLCVKCEAKREKSS